MLARRTDDRGATGDRELDGDGAHRTGRALHEHGVPGADREPVQDPGGRLDASRGAARFLPAPRSRFGRPGGQGREVGVGAARGRGGHAEHLVADAHARDAVADLVHHARGVEAGPERERRGHHVTQRPGADVASPRASPGSPYGDADLARSGVRRLHLGDVHNAGRAVLGELNRSHAPDRNGTPRPFG